MDAELRKYLLHNLQELQADYEDLSDEELIECKDCMLERINNCLKALGETDEDNI